MKNSESFPFPHASCSQRWPCASILVHGAEKGVCLEAPGRDFSSLVKEELPPAALAGSSSLPLAAVWYKGVIGCFMQLFCDNEEKSENWSLDILELLI